MNTLEELTPKNIGGGLLPKRENPKDYSFGAIFGYPELSDLPDEFLHETLGVEHQGEDDCCFAAMLCTVSGVQEDVALEPAYSFKVIKQLMEEKGLGSWQGWGADPHCGAEAALKGFLPKEMSPFHVGTTQRDIYANPANWPTMYDDAAKPYAKRAYFWIEPTKKLDLFDAMRAAVWKFRDEKRLLGAGCRWSPEWNQQATIRTMGSRGDGHEFTIPGWKKMNGEQFMVIQNSYGTAYGDKGMNYFSRQVVNKAFPYGGVLMFQDKPVGETHETIVQKSIYYRASALRKLIIRLQEYVNTIIQ